MHLPTHSWNNPSPRDIVSGVAEAVTRMWPSARVNLVYKVAGSWIESISLPFHPADGPRTVNAPRMVDITCQLGAWSAGDITADPRATHAVDRRPVPLATPHDLVSVVLDALAYIHNRTSPNPNPTEDR